MESERPDADGATGRRALTTDPLLEIRDLAVHFPTAEGALRAVDGVSFDVARGESLGLVGESGCGKSVTALAVLGLVPPPGQIVAGQIRFEGQDLRSMAPAEQRARRGHRIGMVFQEPMRSLNPVLRCGDQVAEVLRTHLSMTRRDAQERVLALFARVGLPGGRDLLDVYPHQLSGGMRQRVMIAMALACDPVLLLADEPTTALDVTIQAQIMSLLADLKGDHDLSVLFISHNLALVAEACERVAVMYAGQIVEMAPVERLFAGPRHPYTRALIDCLPTLEEASAPRPIPGEVPHPLALSTGCRFEERCRRVRPACSERAPALARVAENHWVRCWDGEDGEGENAHED
jgi:oligopeptide/dipeptide ABC transporter ATP-binding protein